jgi:hypothetical protein
LREYLRQLTPGTRALLIEELERAAVRGEDIPGGTTLLAEVRQAARETGGGAPRGDAALRRCLQPLDPFFFDGDPAHKYQGRIARSDVDRLWTWICRDVVPAEARAFRLALQSRLTSDASADCSDLVRPFQDRVASGIRTALVNARRDEKASWRLAVQIGTPNALDDAIDLAHILSHRDALVVIESRLPGHIRSFSEAQIESAKSLLDSADVPRELLPYGLVIVMRRLAEFWQVVRLAIKAAESDVASRIAALPYAAAVTLVLGEIGRLVGELQEQLRRDPASVPGTLKIIHDAVRGLRTEVDLVADSPWSRKLAATRADIGNMLRAHIEPIPSRVRRLLRPRSAAELLGRAAVEQSEVEEIEVLIDIIVACRNYAGELAINEMTLRSYHEVEQYLDAGTSALVESFRHAEKNERRLRQSQIDAAVRFCAKVFGSEYAATLTKAADGSGHGDRKAAQA